MEGVFFLGVVGLRVVLQVVERPLVRLDCCLQLGDLIVDVFIERLVLHQHGNDRVRGRKTHPPKGGNEQCEEDGKIELPTMRPDVGNESSE